MKASEAFTISMQGGSGMWAACGIGNALPWVFGGVMYTAQLGINYRKYKKGAISKQTFERSAQLGAAQTVIGIGGASGGAALGFALGSFASVPGAIIGTVVGGVIGGITGRKLATKLYVSIEDMLE